MGKIGLTYLYINLKNFKTMAFQLRFSFTFDSVCDVKTDSTAMAIVIECLYSLYPPISTSMLCTMESSQVSEMATKAGVLSLRVILSLSTCGSKLLEFMCRI